MASFSKAKQAPVQQWEEDAASDDYGEEPEMMTAEVDPSSFTGIGSSAREDGSELPIDMSEWTQEELAAYNNLRSKRKKCCIGGCTHRSIPIARSYHQLPVRNKDIWAKWIETIRWSRNDPDWAPSGDAAPLVCSRHFPDSDFISYEASSRVRLSHTALPVYYVDPPEGTEMDHRFSGPLPLPPILTTSVKKEAKPKIIDHENAVAENYNKARVNYTVSDSTQYEDNYGYDLEEVNDESYDEMYGGEEKLVPQNLQMRQTNMQPIKYHNAQATKSTGFNKSRMSAPPMLANFQKPKQIINPSRSKPPALIRANFSSMQPAQSWPRLTPKSANGGMLKTIAKREHNTQFINQSVALNNTQQRKHKIGIAKCRLIVDTLENELKVAKMRLAEQLGIPFQLVNGVWNMKDSLKDKLQN